MTSLLPGDLVIVRTSGFFAWLIRLGQMLQGKPDLDNHVAMFHHSADGVNWYLEGRPGGLGWRPFKATEDSYLNSPWTVTTAAQPKTDAQRQDVCAAMRKLLGAPYDWDAIEGDTASALRLPDWWAKWGSSKVMPGHVVCSSAAAWAYPQGGLAAPEVEGGRMTEPGDWEQFVMTQAWAKAPAA